MEEEPSKMLQLSDCVMLQILSYLDATSLYYLSQTCIYFDNIIKDRKLWKFVNARNKPNTEEKLAYCIERIHEDTTHLFLKTDFKKGHLLFFDEVSKILNCKNLTVLSLENQRFCGKKVSLRDFPPKLEELSLRKTHVRNGKTFFQHSSSSISNLRVLILDECNWLDRSFIMSVSKFANLEIISIVKCNKLHYYIVPYLSVARHGCKKLKVLDCRFSTAGNDFVRTFDENENILALYFQSMRSYQQDYDKPLVKNMEKVQNLNPDDVDLISQSIINNRSLYNYKFAMGIDCNIEELPESVLYEDPYPSCTCKYQDHKETPEKGRTDPAEESSGKNLMKVDDFMNFRSAAPQKFVCKRHTNAVENLPKEFKDFFVQNQLMFHAGQTDSDSGSDSDFDSDDCCMYGMGKEQRLILLRLNDIDSEGNLPQPEAIVLNSDNSMEVERICIDPFRNTRNEVEEPQEEVIYQVEFPERLSADSTTNDTPSISRNESTSSMNMSDSSASQNMPSTSRHVSSASTSSSSSTSLSSTSQNVQNSDVRSSTSKNTPETSVLTSENLHNHLDNPSIVNFTACSSKESSENQNESREMKGTKRSFESAELFCEPSTSQAAESPLNKKRRQETNSNVTSAEDTVHQENKSREDDEFVDAMGLLPNPTVRLERIPVNNEAVDAIVPDQHNDYDSDDSTEPLYERLQMRDFFLRPAVGVPEEHNKKKKLKLRRLSLRGYRKVTDSALNYIRNLKIDLLDLTHTSVTKRGIEQFLSYNPNCRVIHKDFCVCKPRIPS